MRDDINSQIKEEMGKNQREYVLRQQLKAIKEELGEDEGDQGDLDGLEERIAEGEACRRRRREVAKKQLKRLRNMQVGSRRVHGRPHLPRLDPRSAVARPDAATTWTSRRCARCSTRTTTASRRSRSASSSTWRSASSRRTRRAPSCASSGRPASARRRSARASRGRSGRKFVPHLARRRARRGRHPRAPPHLRRRAARADHPGHEEGGDHQPGLHARRGRQDRARLPRRSRRRRCSRCSIPSRTTPSPTTTSRSPTTCRT